MQSTIKALLISSLCICVFILQAQISNTQISVSEAHLGQVPEMHAQCITLEQSLIMQSKLRQKAYHMRTLHPENYLNLGGVGHPLFQMPIRAKEGFDDYGYFGIPYFVDHAPVDYTWEDYSCGSRTYDWTTGNHAGTDYVLWPYSWRRMDEEVMEVVAVADGIIIDKVDGNYDRSCVNAGGEGWNAIYLEHSDGSITWYLHFKDGSLTTKNVGENVAAGEFLGLAGSSGSSSIPHLHFQVFDADDNLIDPYQGPCNDFNDDSWWESQEPYLVPSINHISTHSGLYVYDCPEPEITNEKDTFLIGDSIYLLIFYRDLDFNSLTQIRIYDPSNIIVSFWDFYSPWALSALGWTYWYLISDTTFATGEWKFEADFGGITYSHNFFIIDEIEEPVSVDFIESNDEFTVSQNPVLDFVQLNFESTYSEESTVNIIGMNGKLYYADTWQLLTGKNTKLIALSNLPSGIYIIKMQAAEGNYFHRVLRTDK